MKTYKMHLLIKLFILTIIILTIGGSIYLLLDNETTLVIRIFSLLAAVYGPIGCFHFAKMKVNVDTKKIEIVATKMFPGTGTLKWEDIIEVRSFYFLYPESGGITLIPKPKTGKSIIRFSIAGMPIELVREILANVPKETKVYLYPYLKRKVEGKQTIFYTK